ncbi:MAG: hypothetical protein DME34_04100 [Verrucomicrobia bacterium]|nr:MAG: hypothetical protein DME34_04100 [Verrucomicrobiota bacterium]
MNTLILVAHGAEELLVPAQRAKKLRSNFVFGFKIVGEVVGVADPRHFKARFEKLRPQLQSVPGKGDVLPENELAVVANAATSWKCGRSFRKQIWPRTGGETEVPHFVRAKTGPAAEGRMFETDVRDAPRFGPGGERRVLYFGGVIEFVDGAGHGKPAGVTWPPNNRQTQILIRVIPAVVFADVSPSEQGIDIIRRGSVPDSGNIFIRQRRVDERIVQ